MISEKFIHIDENGIKHVKVSVNTTIEITEEDLIKFNASDLKSVIEVIKNNLDLNDLGDCILNTIENEPKQVKLIGVKNGN